MRRIYLDLDGVLVDWAGGMLDLMGLDARRAGAIDVFDGGTMMVARARGLTFEQADELIWDTINDRGESFWRDLRWLPWGQALLRDCCRLAPTLILTAPSPHPSSAAGKMRWRDKHDADLAAALSLCPGAEQRRRPARLFALCTAKEEFAHDGAVLIDDKPENVERFRAAGGRAVLWPAPWNDHRGLDYDAAFAMLRRIVNACDRPVSWRSV